VAFERQATDVARHGVAAARSCSVADRAQPDVACVDVAVTRACPVFDSEQRMRAALRVASPVPARQAK
jgi:hypothetical protein